MARVADALLRRMAEEEREREKTGAPAPLQSNGGVTGRDDEGGYQAEEGNNGCEGERGREVESPGEAKQSAGRSEEEKLALRQMRRRVAQYLRGGRRCG